LLDLQRLPEAAAAYAGALAANPHVAALLRAARAPRMPEVDGFRVGSPEEARIAVANQHDLWRDKALRQWLEERAGPPAGRAQLPLI
jgi:hypothetical protein